MTARSMTGYAQVKRGVADCEVQLQLKAVNHRGLDLHFHLPSAFVPWEPVARAALQKEIARGHVELRVSVFLQKETNAATLNRALLDRWRRAFDEAALALDSTALPDPNVALQVPGMLETSTGIPEWSADLEHALSASLEDAISDLNSFRDREGVAIAGDFERRARAVLCYSAEIERIRSTALPAFQQRLGEKLADLLGHSTIDPVRLAQEAALLCSRSDISEEVQRLRTHSHELLALLAATGEKGKKLDFLLQEVNREANTVLSKTSGLGDDGLTLTSLALGIKADVDKMREQALNLE